MKDILKRFWGYICAEDTYASLTFLLTTTCSIFQRYVINYMLEIVILYSLFIYYNAMSSILSVAYIINSLYIGAIIYDICVNKKNSILFKGIVTSNKLFFKMKHSMKKEKDTNYMAERVIVFLITLILELYLTIKVPIFIASLIFDHISYTYELLYYTIIISSMVGIFINIMSNRSKRKTIKKVSNIGKFEIKI